MPNLISIDEAREALKSAERVLVIGCSGGGKTTLSTRIADKFTLDYLSLDRDVRWLPNWTVRDNTEQRQIITDLVQRPRWVFDGTSPSTFDIRLPRTDLVIWMRVPRYKALLGLAKRVAANYGRVRFAMAEGCKEPMPDREFLSYIWNFEKKSSPAIDRQIEKYGPQIPLATVRSDQDCDALLR